MLGKKRAACAFTVLTLLQRTILAGRFGAATITLRYTASRPTKNVTKARRAMRSDNAEESAEREWNWLCNCPADMADGIRHIMDRDARIRAEARREMLDLFKKRCHVSLIAAVSEEWLNAHEHELLNGKEIRDAG